jgi:hypothetical protein
MAYQYRFVDVLARGLENAANRAERAEAARVQQEQFKTEMGQRKKEASALDKIRQREADLAQERLDLDKIKTESQAWRDEAQYQLDLERLEVQKEGLEVQKEAAKARGEVAVERPTVEARFLPPEVRERLQLADNELIDIALLPTYNTLVKGMDLGEGGTNMYEFLPEQDLLVSGTGWKRILNDRNTSAKDRLVAQEQLVLIQRVLGKDVAIPEPEKSTRSATGL